MAKQTVVIQLIVDSRMIWQVKRDVSRELCRRMSDVELTRIGNAVEQVMEDMTTMKPIAPIERKRGK